MGRISIILCCFITLSGFLFSECGSDSTTGPGANPGAKNSKMADKLEVGSKAPDFSLPDQNGRRINLVDYLGKLNLVLFFYPKDESYGCTKEACSFRDNYEVFQAAGAAVVGISSDNIASHQAFAANHKLPFLLLSDKDKAVAEKYGVGKSLGVVPGRVTYVIDKQGIIRMIFSSQLNFDRHVKEAMDILQTMK